MSPPNPSRTDAAEHAVFIAKPDMLERAEGEFDRLYYGCEFCERLIPSRPRLEEALTFAAERDMAFTCITPYVTDAGADRLKPTLEWLAENRPGAEVVVNDWGMLHFLSERELPLEPVLGRLLTKQKRGPRLLRVTSRVPEAMVDHFRRSNVDVPVLREFLQSKGVHRVELDNLPHGIARDPGMPASLYYPYLYVSTTRLCLSNSCDRRTKPLRAIFPCGQECQTYTFRLSHEDMPVELLLRGNTQFYVNEKLPDNLHELGIDRLVFEPEIPL